MTIEAYHGVHRQLVERFGRGGDALYTFTACVLALTVSGLDMEFGDVRTGCLSLVAGIRKEAIGR